MKKIINSLLIKTNPKVIFELIHYSLPNLIINEQAKKLNIPTVEIQHGVIGKFSIAYNYNYSISSPFFPDFFGSFGDFWKAITHFPIRNENVFTIGFPYLTETAEKYNTEEKNSGKTKILIISQGTVGKSLVKFITNYLNIYPDRNEEVIFKLHPSEYDIWENNYPALSHPRIKVIDNDDEHLYKLISEAHKVLGVYSTALFEALYFNVPVGVYKTEGYFYLKDFIIRGNVKLIESPEDLINLAKAKNADNTKIWLREWESGFAELVNNFQ
jgi:hypothetical protein